MRILLVEDDQDLCQFVREGLARESFVVDAAANGREALMMAEMESYDVILLDIMMPQLDGLSALQKLRSRGYKGAILLVTCKGQERDKLAGLNNGADDYIVKPFLLTELVARIRAILRRMGGPAGRASGSILKVGDLEMDLLKRQLKRAGKAIALTKTEFEILECMMRHPGEVLSTSVLNQKVSGVPALTFANAIEAHIKNIRAKLDGKSKKSIIRTVYGCGYALDV